MQKIKEFLGSKYMRMSTMMLAAMTVMAVGCFANDGTGGSNASTITSSFATGFQSIVSDATTMIATIVPIALGLAGVIFLVRKAMGWFKSMAK